MEHKKYVERINDQYQQVMYTTSILQIMKDVPPEISKRIEYCSFLLYWIMIRVKTREDLAVVRGHFKPIEGRTWHKSVQEDCIQYSADLSTNIKMDITCGELPPTCHIEEVIEHIPAQPAGERVVRKVVCNDGKELVEA